MSDMKEQKKKLSKKHTKNIVALVKDIEGKSNNHQAKCQFKINLESAITDINTGEFVHQ